MRGKCFTIYGEQVGKSVAHQVSTTQIAHNTVYIGLYYITLHMFVFSMSNLSLEIRSYFRDSVDMNVNHGKIKVCILFGGRWVTGAGAGIPCSKMGQNLWIQHP